MVVEEVLVLPSLDFSEPQRWEIAGGEKEKAWLSRKRWFEILCCNCGCEDYNFEGFFVRSKNGPWN